MAPHVRAHVRAVGRDLEALPARVLDRRGDELTGDAAVTAWDAKLDGILSYPSQLNTIFRHYVGVEPSREGIRNALNSYASESDEVNIGERFWVLSDAPIHEGS